MEIDDGQMNRQMIGGQTDGWIDTERDEQTERDGWTDRQEWMDRQ